MEKKLYIIGNGFDCYHDLPTEYAHFHRFLMDNFPDLEEQLNQYFDFKVNKDKLWSDFETDLGAFKFDMFYNETNSKHFATDDIYAFITNDIDDSFVSKLRNAFLEWFKSIDYRNVYNRLFINNDALFLTFNYTSLLEDIYLVSDNSVLHIHGTLKDKNLIFGHNRKVINDPEFDKDGQFIKATYSDSQSFSLKPLSDFYKPVDEMIKNNYSFFSHLSLIDEIFVLGYSFNMIDSPYLKEIVKQSSDAKWVVSYHKNIDRLNIKKSLDEYGVLGEKIRLIKLDNLKNTPLTDSRNSELKKAYKKHEIFINK